MIAATHTEGWQVATLDPSSGAADVVRRGRPVPIDPAYISRPEPIVFPTEGGLTAHANYYPPANPDFVAPEGELPPLLVNVHGGPTSSHDAKLDLDIQYWTSRGIAVVDVNYGGSTGYGRAYRERLHGEWGVVDTVDSINAARYLIARGDADPARVGVRGGSAGGYTTLNALTRYDFFSAGASLFGLADLETFATGGTHKFESQYLESLVGPYPERRDVYRERSPIHHVDDISCPVILLQGLDDAIVPPDQADIIVEALQRKGLPYAYLAFEGEQHGFRKAENIIRAEEAELYFYGRVWGFTPADEIEPVAIENLEEAHWRARAGLPAVRGVYSDAMRIRSISLVALGVAGIIAAVAIIAAPAFSAPSTAAAASTEVAKPPVVKKYIRYGGGRKAQMEDYSKRHYKQHTYVLTNPKAIVLHHTAGSTWQSAWNTFDANTAYNDEKPGVSAQFIIHKDGTIYQLMPLDYRARHCIGMNWKSIGIEFVQESAVRQGRPLDGPADPEPRQADRRGHPPGPLPQGALRHPEQRHRRPRDGQRLALLQGLHRHQERRRRLVRRRGQGLPREAVEQPSHRALRRPPSSVPPLDLDPHPLQLRAVRERVDDQAAARHVLLVDEAGDGHGQRDVDRLLHAAGAGAAAQSGRARARRAGAGWRSPRCPAPAGPAARRAAPPRAPRWSGRPPRPGAGRPGRGSRARRPRPRAPARRPAACRREPRRPAPRRPASARSRRRRRHSSS